MFSSEDDCGVFIPKQRYKFIRKNWNGKSYEEDPQWNMDYAKLDTCWICWRTGLFKDGKNMRWL
jgi:hypothetical protein